jgi:hypothetical protein
MSSREAWVGPEVDRLRRRDHRPRSTQGGRFVEGAPFDERAEKGDVKQSPVDRR